MGINQIVLKLEVGLDKGVPYPLFFLYCAPKSYPMLFINVEGRWVFKLLLKHLEYLIFFMLMSSIFFWSQLEENQKGEKDFE